MPLDEARYQQDLDFVAMREQHRQAMKDLDMVVGRVQRLVWRRIGVGPGVGRVAQYPGVHD